MKININEHNYDKYGLYEDLYNQKKKKSKRNHHKHNDEYLDETINTYNNDIEYFED